MLKNSIADRSPSHPINRGMFPRAWERCFSSQQFVFLAIKLLMLTKALFYQLQAFECRGIGGAHGKCVLE